MSAEKPEVLAIIPARGGSKRIPRKNIVDLCGKPLIAYSIEVALNTPQVTRVIVSTEDREIADVAMAYGATVPFLRPKELAGDASVIGEAVRFTLDKLKDSGYQPDLVFELYPTSVFRTPKQLQFLIDKLLGGYSYVKTVKPIPVSRYSFLTLQNDGKLLPAISGGLGSNGAEKIFFKSYGLFTGQSLNQSGASRIYLHKLTDPISLIDIDAYCDLYLAEEVIKRRLFNFGLK